MEMTTSCCTVTSTANTTVLILDNKNYDRLVTRKNAHTVNKLKDGVLKKLQSRLATPNGSHIRLFKVVHDDLHDFLQPKQKVPASKLLLLKEKQSMASQMIHLYLEDKTPLIDPVLPDSFYYRLMTEKRSKILGRTQRRRDRDRLYSSRPRRRVARSMKQLQNSAAESELLHPRRTVSEFTPQPPSSKPAIREKLLRPRTAIGIERYSSGDLGRQLERPGTATGCLNTGVFHLTECDIAPEAGDYSAITEKEVPVTEEVGHVVSQIDSFQRDKQESRLKLVCSTTVKSELRADLDRARINTPVAEFFDVQEDEYFDYETSASKLRQLEGRIKDFCSKVGRRRVSDTGVNVNELRCFQVEVRILNRIKTE